MKFQPNHVCKNPRCPYGVDNKPKKYYACNACDKTGYRRIACSRDCYAEILKIEQHMTTALPDRTDMTAQEVESMMSQPLEAILVKTKQDLSEYAEEIEAVGIEAVVDMINDEIDKNVE